MTNDSQFLSRLKYNRAKVLSLSLPLNDIVRSGSIGGKKEKTLTRKICGARIIVEERERRVDPAENILEAFHKY